MAYTARIKTQSATGIWCAKCLRGERGVKGGLDIQWRFLLPARRVVARKTTWG